MVENGNEDHLLQSLASSRESVIKLNEENKDLIAALENSNEEIERLSSEGVHLQSKYKQIQSQLQQSEQFIDEQSKSMEALTQEHAKYKEKCSYLTLIG